MATEDKKTPFNPTWITAVIALALLVRDLRKDGLQVTVDLIQPLLMIGVVGWCWWAAKQFRAASKDAKEREAASVKMGDSFNMRLETAKREAVADAVKHCNFEAQRKLEASDQVALWIWAEQDARKLVHAFERLMKESSVKNPLADIDSEMAPETVAKVLVFQELFVAHVSEFISFLPGMGTHYAIDSQLIHMRKGDSCTSQELQGHLDKHLERLKRRRDVEAERIGAIPVLPRPNPTESEWPMVSLARSKYSNLRLSDKYGASIIYNQPGLERALVEVRLRDLGFGEPSLIVQRLIDDSIICLQPDDTVVPSNNPIFAAEIQKLTAKLSLCKLFGVELCTLFGTTGPPRSCSG